MISNSGHDERSKYSGGKAGDQTGTEWYIRSWYDRGWTHCIAFEDVKVRECICQLSIEAANNDNVGYDQGNRTSYNKALENAGFRPKNIKVKCEADCSAGVAANVRATGYLLNIPALKNVSPDAYTGNLVAVLKKAGAKIYTDKKYLTSEKYLKDGYILLYEGHHVCVYVGNGKHKHEIGKLETKDNVIEVPFKKYALTDTQVRGLAALCLQEQGCLKGVMAEASLMCNLFEKQTKYKNLVDYVLKSGWFAKVQTYYNKGVNKSVGSKYDEAVKNIICNGLRVLPNYIDEHDCFSDIKKATNDGKQINKKDRSAYKKGVTKIRNTYGSSYTFYCFPDSTCDPFGYTKKDSDDFHFDYDGNPVNTDISITIPSQNGFPFIGMVTATSGLNMRLEPSSAAKKATKTPSQPCGAKVTVLSETVNNKNEKWYLIEKNGNRAYCSAKYIKKC